MARGLHLPTGSRRTMENHLLPLPDKLLSRQRSSIKTLSAKSAPSPSLTSPELIRLGLQPLPPLVRYRVTLIRSFPSCQDPILQRQGC